MIDNDESVRTKSISDILQQLDESKSLETNLSSNVTLKYTINHFLRGLGSPKHFDRMVMANCISQV